MMVYLKFVKSLMLHKWYVFWAGIQTGVPLWRLIVHDWQKLSPYEFAAYAKNFHSDEDASVPFARAWLHHENTAPHHWGYWIPRSGKYAGQPLGMPEAYVREMVADWMGASRAYTGSWDMTDWLDKNLAGFPLHADTSDKLCRVLRQLGYSVFIDSAGNIKPRPKVNRK